MGMGMGRMTVDRIARLLGGAATRRHGVLAVLGAVGAGFLPGDPAAADRQANHGREDVARIERDPRPDAEGPCGDGTIKANRCSKNRQCCTGVCQRKRKGETGRCRCFQHGRPCTANRNCCGSAKCTGGVCGGAAAPVPTGDPCHPASGACQDPDASCRAFDGGDPAATYCLLPRGARCTGAAECASRICLEGRCLACSHPACHGACTPNVCPTCAYTTVQAAIDALQGTASNVVTIAAGRYVEDLTVTGDLVLRACPGATG